ncbi:MAG: carboxynorspermidine decarboxylase, partial [Desulfovibrio sp.]|nr:carboxynorspermidine decarboxylase [Desulfovibrio sp.]
LDVVMADMPVAVLDVSAACHMPDVLEMPYRPGVFYRTGDAAPRKAAEAGADAWTCRLAGKSCLAGDVIGEYAFAAPLHVGQRLVFADMAIYSMVKTTTFNGLRLPSIGICRRGEDAPGQRFQLLRQFGYEDFRGRLS